MQLTHLSLFLTIVEKGSLAAAGRELGLAATTVSERLLALESHYGVTLLNRTTRAISLTDEGRTLVEGARHVLAAADELDSRVRLGAKTLSGLIRISAPIDLGRNKVKAVIDDFLTEHPNISIELQLSDGYVNIIDQGLDMAVRFGELADSSLRAKNLGINQRIVCASPDYLAQQGKPNTPNDLKKHNCLLMRFGGQLDNVWGFKIDGKMQQINVQGNRIANDGVLVHDWCLAGFGIAFKSHWDVADELKKGNLIELLAEFSAPATPIQILYPPSRSQPRRVKELSNALVKAFES